MRELDLPGKLFIVEGIDGSGKSTQLDLLHKWLVGQGYLVVFSEWNSSPIVKGTTRRGKRRALLSPMSFSLIHAADFASRTSTCQILPALESGAMVLADRYVYTAFVRDAVRGVNRGGCAACTPSRSPPTLAFYFDVPLAEAIRRILGRPARAQVVRGRAGPGPLADPARVVPPLPGADPRGVRPDRRGVRAGPDRRHRAPDPPAAADARDGAAAPGGDARRATAADRRRAQPIRALGALPRPARGPARRRARDPRCASTATARRASGAESCPAA